MENNLFATLFLETGLDNPVKRERTVATIVDAVRSANVVKSVRDTRTAKQIVEQLGIKKGDLVSCADSVTRKVKSISPTGEVRLSGVRGPVNVRNLKRAD